jgi:SNF2 family DNA or RNA helicase
MHVKHGDTRVLVICPKSVIGVWKREIRKHLPDNVKLRWVIINYEQTYTRQRTEGRSWEPVPRKALYKYDPELVIIDEAHRISDPTARQSKEIYKLVKKTDARVLIMTGSPVHRKPLSLYGQFKVIDDSVFGTNWGVFKSTYALWGGYAKNQVLRYINLKQLRRRIKPLTYYTREVDKVPPVKTVVPVPLVQAAKAYDNMARESITMIKGQAVTAEIVVTRLLRLQQISGGVTKSEDGKWLRVGREKQAAIKDLLSDMLESDVQRVVIAARFIPEIRDIGEAARDVGYKIFLLHGGVNDDDERTRRIADFDDWDGPSCFIFQVGTGGEGIDLSSSDTMIFYSLTSLLQHDQAAARIKKYKEKRTLNYYYLCAPGFDMARYQSIQEQRDLVDMVMNHPELLERE